MRESGAVGCLGAALLPDLSREPRGVASAERNGPTTVGRGPALDRAAPAVGGAVSDLRVSAPVGTLAGPDSAQREQEGGVSSAEAAAVVGPSAVVYASTTRPRLGESGQSEQ
jgi:hypothetical protein